MGDSHDANTINIKGFTDTIVDIIMQKPENYLSFALGIRRDISLFLILLQISPSV